MLLLVAVAVVVIAVIASTVWTVIASTVVGLVTIPEFAIVGATRLVRRLPCCCCCCCYSTCLVFRYDECDL